MFGELQVVPMMDNQPPLVSQSIVLWGLMWTFRGQLRL
jgi:hypothetical protein